MKDFELELGAVAALLGYSRDVVASMVDQGILVARGSGDAQRISFDSVARFVGVHADQMAVRNAEKIFQDRSTWMRVFGSHQEMFAPDDFEHFPRTPMGASLQRAIAISEIRSA